MWRILQQQKPDDYVLATGKTYSVRDFVEIAFAEVGTTLVWRGKGVEERGVCARTGRVLVCVDPIYFRPTEVDSLVGNPAKALNRLGWRSTTTLQEMVAEMVAHDMAEMRDLPRHPTATSQAFTRETSPG